MKKVILPILFVLIVGIHITVMPLETIYASDVEVEKRIVQEQMNELKILLIEARLEERIALKMKSEQELEAAKALVVALELKERVLQNNYIKLVDKSNGKFTKKIKNGVYFGEVNNIGLMHGVGQATWNNGAKYLGSWENGEMSGTGKYIYASGSYYEGEFSEDVFHGKGLLVKENGESYEGVFERDEIVEGIYKTKEVVYEGGFKDFKFNGYGVLKKQLTSEEGVFSKGQMLLGKIVYQDRSKSEQSVKDGKIIKKGKINKKK